MLRPEIDEFSRGRINVTLNGWKKSALAWLTCWVDSHLSLTRRQPAGLKKRTVNPCDGAILPRRLPLRIT